MKLLYVEDNPADADLTRRALARRMPECSVDVAGTVEAALARLDGAPDYDLVLSDLLLPDGKGLDVLTHVRARGLPLAVVILTGSGDQEAAVAALKAGADDYLLKRADYLDRLPQTIQAAVTRFRTRSARRARPIRVLYTEHNAFDVDLTLRHLAQYAPHIHVDVAAGASEALARLPHGPGDPSAYDVVLLDYRLPELDALDLTKILRVERGLDLPIVLVTGQGSEQVAIQALHLGVDDYLAKHSNYLFELPAVLEKAHQQAELTREQAALRESEEKYRRLVEGLKEEYFFYQHDPDGVFTYLSPSLANVLGYTPEEFRIHYTEVLTDSPVNHEAIRRTERGINGVAQRPYEIEVRHKDGSIRQLELLESPLLDRAGTVVAVEGIAHDITVRKGAEERLRQAATVFTSTQEGVVITDLDARIQAVNPAFCEITGYDEAEVRGMNMRIFRSDHHDRAFFQAMWAGIRETGHWRGELWNRRKDGEIYPQWLTINTVRNDRGDATNYVGVFTDISQLKQVEARLQHLAHYDPLTDLPNRLLVQSRLEHALERSRRRDRRVGVLFIDLDQFKTVNDSLGHPVGDELLQVIAQRLRARLRNEDTLARLGGDEFLVVLEDIERPDDAAAVAQVLSGLLDAPCVLSGGREVYIGASIGISIFPDDGASGIELIQHADAAMYQAKKQGRNTCRFYTEAMTQAANERLALETRLRGALTRGEFVLHYQPMVSVADGRAVGVEALLRWQDPDAGLIAPARFIPIAEETGLIVPLGYWVLQTACAQARRWLDAGLSLSTLAVNLSARQFRFPEIVDQVRGVLAETRLPPGCLELEITESAIMEQGAQAESVLQALKALGVRLAIDDFGTGYSSLAYLKRFPLDTLKIDQSFVRGLAADASDREIAATIIAMARTLNLKVLAEGVETDEQLAVLKTQGCETYQGFLFSPAVPAGEVEALLTNGSAPRP